MTHTTPHTPGARLLRAVFAGAFLVLAVVVRDQPTDGWFAPHAWPWITGATGAILAWSVVSMSERADTWASAAIVVTSVLWIAAVVDVARLAITSGRPPARCWPTRPSDPVVGPATHRSPLDPRTVETPVTC